MNNAKMLFPVGVFREGLGGQKERKIRAFQLLSDSKRFVLSWDEKTQGAHRTNGSILSVSFGSLTSSWHPLALQPKLI